ncbi:hypothetical protein AB0L75_44520, partial [Streptomyces sp. NPDC052101]|uniref:hypothetical protein n=1 Tax=Streptomyces sp. NPDC052101 TaxID=3155763 RepID=UPI0034243D69
VFYAAEDAKVPMVVQVSGSLLMLLLSWAGAMLLPLWSMALWVAVASSVSYVYQFVLTHVLTVRRFGDYGLASVLRAHVQTGLAALAAAAAGVVVVWLLGGYTGGFAWNSIGTALLTCAVAAVAMGPVYLMVLRAMRFPELDDALRPLVARVPALGRLLRVGRSLAATATPRIIGFRPRRQEKSPCPSPSPSAPSWAAAIASPSTW